MTDGNCRTSSMGSIDPLQDIVWLLHFMMGCPSGEETVSGWEVYTLAPGANDPPKSVRRITTNGYSDAERGGVYYRWSPTGQKIFLEAPYGKVTTRIW